MEEFDETNETNENVTEGEKMSTGRKDPSFGENKPSAEWKCHPRITVNSVHQQPEKTTTKPTIIITYATLTAGRFMKTDFELPAKSLASGGISIFPETFRKTPSSPSLEITKGAGVSCFYSTKVLLVSLTNNNGPTVLSVYSFITHVRPSCLFSAGFGNRYGGGGGRGGGRVAAAI